MIAALRRVHDAFNRGDFEAVGQLVRPDVEVELYLPHQEADALEAAGLKE